MQTSAILLPWLKKSVWLNHERYQIVFFQIVVKCLWKNYIFYRLKLNISKLNPSYEKVAGVCIFLQITWPMSALFGCTFLYNLAPRSTREVDLGAKYIFSKLERWQGSTCKFDLVVFANASPDFYLMFKKIRLYW